MTAPAWKIHDKPPRGGPETTREVAMYKEKVTTELKIGYAAVTKSLKKIPKEILTAQNTYFSKFSKPDSGPVSHEHPFAYDRVKDSTPYDPRMPHDTFHTKHSEASRKRCSTNLETKWPLRTSQAYGWLPAIDQPNYGFNRSSPFVADCMDKSHLGCGAAVKS
eukprot:gnl/TRDRNA2_/TRDRNA2_180073_c0_seq1.p1 gnl/TRDRNA2_/TRDRNA2_180073_c0~~gnl/TRDRNA2_/TRDRNA2_180073_c0_seq1.p1  ORF type:complete len:163 (-),score=25.68 gnl/TRDRNA2_/TRDRNA2_180073_c0_seq1:288-776(-)